MSSAETRRLRTAGLLVDLLLEEPDQDRRALRVADEDDAAAVVVVSEVVAERREDAPVGDEGVARA